MPPPDTIKLSGRLEALEGVRSQVFDDSTKFIDDFGHLVILVDGHLELGHALLLQGARLARASPIFFMRMSASSLPLTKWHW
jgi:hypothetical protein